MPYRPFKLPRAWGLIVLCLLLGLSACGGGGGGGGAAGASGTTAPPVTPVSTAVQVGTFFDAPVVNLQYLASPSGLNGMTDARGNFSFKAGDSVAFSFAGLALGSATPVTSQAGVALVTPLALTGETDPANAPKAWALVRLLQALDQISSQDGFGSSGALVLPLASYDNNTHYPALVSGLLALGNAQAVSASQLQGVLDAVYGAATYTALSDVSAQALLTQALTSSGVAGTVWSGAVTTPALGSSTGWYLYFSPDHVFYAFTASGTSTIGAWSPNTDGSVSAYSSGPGNALASASVAAGATTLSGTGIDASGNATTLSASERLAAAAQPNTYTGAWHASFTPAAGGQATTTALLLVDPLGNLAGLASDGSLITGTVNLSSGIASATSSASSALLLALDFAGLSGSETGAGGAVQDTIALSRSVAF